MVLPLIPAALIAIGAVTGGSGIALGGKGAWDFKRAQEEFNKTRGQYARRRKRSEVRVALTNRRLEDLGVQQKEALTNVVLRMAEFMRRNQHKIREHERLLVEGVDAEMNKVPEMGGLDVSAAAWIGAVVSSVTAAAGTNMGVTAAATTVGAASTGAAISGLSGAAAESAMLAFLGGGSLAAGGGGVALGTAALNVVAIGPALLLGGFVAKGQGQKQITRAEEFKAKVAVETAAMDVFDVGLAAIDARVGELKTLLTELIERAVAALDLLESEPFDAVSHASRFQQAMTLAVAVRDVAAAPIVDAEGELTEQSANLTVKYRRMTEGNDNA